jgi:hypothetical protein
MRMLLIEGSFLPAGRTLYGAGSKGKFNATLSNCYTCPNVQDSLDSIYESNREIATIFKAGGGIGINLSDLRPNGARTNNAARTSTGAVSFIHLYNATGSIIGFHGRRGATLVGLRISHPDIEEFVELRKSKGVTREDAIKILGQNNYFGTMLVKMGYGDCLLGGATYLTADTVRPAFQLVKTKPGNNIVTSCFILVRPRATGDNEVIAMGDCAITIDPSEDDLVEIATETIKCAKIFGMDPKVAFLSY